MAHHGNNQSNRIGYIFDYNIIRGINKAREQLAKASVLLRRGKDCATDSKTYDYSHFERLFMLPSLIKDIDSTVTALASCSIALDAYTAIDEMLKLMKEKVDLECELEFRQAAFNKIPAFDRELLYLRFGRHYNFEKIAEIKNMNIRTIIRHITSYGISKDITIIETCNNKIVTIPTDFTIKCCKEAV